MAKLEGKGRNLLIDGKKVVEGWESFTGWYWFATEKGIDGDPDLCFGFVQGLAEEWGYFHLSELRQSARSYKCWKLRQSVLPNAGRRNAG